MRVVFDFKPAYTLLDDVKARQLPYAHSLALTNTAMFARRAVIDEFKRQFDRPKPSTISEKSGPLRVKTASRSKYPNDYSEVRVKDQAQGNGDPALVYLNHHIRSGARVEKRSEVLLRRAGILGPREFAIPADGAVFDAYGNMKQSQVQEILQGVGAQQATLGNTRGRTLAQGYKNIRRRQARGRQYFIARKGIESTKHLAEGVWQRYSGSEWNVRPVLIFIKHAPRYRRRIRWEEMAIQVGRMRFPIEFHLAMRKAIETARIPPTSIVGGLTEQVGKSYRSTSRLLDRLRTA